MESILFQITTTIYNQGVVCGMKTCVGCYRDICDLNSHLKAIESEFKDSTCYCSHDIKIIKEN